MHVTVLKKTRSPISCHYCKDAVQNDETQMNEDQNLKRIKAQLIKCVQFKVANLLILAGISFFRLSEKT